MFVKLAFSNSVTSALKRASVPELYRRYVLYALSILLCLGVIGPSYAKTAPVSAPQSAPAGQYEILWVNVSDRSLWLTRYPSGENERLYGRGVEGSSIDLSFALGSDGATVAVGDGRAVALFDIRKPGARKSIRKRNELADVWAYEIIRDCSGVLMSRHAPNEQEAIYTGICMSRSDGSQSLIARPKRKDLVGDVFARYSPDYSKLLLHNEAFIQVIDVRTNKTLVYKESDSLPDELADGMLSQMLWLDNDRIVVSGHGLLLLNARTGGVIYPWVGAVVDATDLEYARDAKHLYAFTSSGGPVLYRINVANRRCDRLTIPRLRNLTTLMSVSSDGRLALFDGDSPTHGNSALWVVELSTSKSTRISDFARGIFVASGSRRSSVAQPPAAQSKR